MSEYRGLDALGPHLVDSIFGKPKEDPPMTRNKTASPTPAADVMLSMLAALPWRVVDGTGAVLAAYPTKAEASAKKPAGGAIRHYTEDLPS